ncbi:DNA-binding GntR family transcriptional regulator [Nocardioides cavernae]|uniref:DNA-binding GntR family transcriptional regulator n=1 Tax=Nocardioides cavernae TaxID=1921566 RepID=A0A7Y9GZU5_9ACTN|nr:GntR family transcriptional regulator [Nocardioides cavernae]NYE35375.1 DNA-binding GntR family transcriptional regulator [Nocardioides cavernae]
MTEPAGVYATKSDYAYMRLRDGILSGEFEPGTVLHQATLAKTIGISTTPLREAMRRLMTEGLVELDAHRDARVSALTGEEARDLLEVRRSLDPLAASLAAQRRTKDDIKAMREAAASLHALPNQPSVVDLVAHRRFHAAVYTASHNDLLISTLDALWDKADRYRRLGLQEEREQGERDQKEREHAELLDAVVRGDSDGAAAVMLQHIATSLGAKAVNRLGADHDAPHLTSLS